MAKISQYLLIILATIFVGFLGYHTYNLATSTLYFSFLGAENQSGKKLMISLDRPWFATSSYDELLDQDAIVGAMSKNGKKWNPTTSGEEYFAVKNNTIELTPAAWSKGDQLIIDATIYNATTKKKWELPRNISFTYSDDPRTIETKRIGQPKDMTYKVTTYGYGDLDVSDVRWYIGKMGPNESCGMNLGDPQLWTRVKTREIEKHTISQRKIGTYQLELENYPSDACIIAGLAGDTESIVFAPLDRFTATGVVTDILSSEYNMLSRIEFRFSTDIFTDSGTLYSDEYLEHRQRAKNEFLKRLNITEGINITEDNLELSPNKAVIYANLIEGTQYSLNIDTIEDIYGRKTSMNMDILAKSVPSLSLKIPGNKTIFKYGDPVEAKLYRSQGAKNEYNIELCQIGIDGYARVERMNELRNKSHIQSVYDLLGSREVSSCVKKAIPMIQGTTVSTIPMSLFVSGGLAPGLYILAFSDKSDISTIDRWVPPRVFSVIDTHITMKIDSSGKMQFLATDIRTGVPRADQSITLRNNISQLYTQDTRNSYNIIYTPLSAQSWGTGTILGRTGKDGTLQKDRGAIDGYDPYSLTSEWWGEYEGRYNSFVALSQGNGHLGYLVSTWNDGITGWNFGMKESDYSWETRSLYSAYIHTDRRLYLPGDTIYIKGYLRKNEKSLSIPEGEEFDINITDQEGKSIASKRIKANAYGSIATTIILSKDTTLGSYSVGVQLVRDPNIYIGNGYANFQVEIFSNPTFTATVQLSSHQVTNGVINNIREITNTDTSTPWYDKSYKSNITIEGVVKARYYNGSEIKSVPLTYRIYRSVHYDMSNWGDCFWGCYYEPTPEFYTEGTGSIDADGYGIIRADVEFSSFSDDYIYTVEVTIRDPLTSQSITSAATLLVGLGQQYKMTDMDNPLQATVSKKILKPGDILTAIIKPKRGKWDQSLSKKYRYEFVHRVYRSASISTLRGESTPIINSTDTRVREGSIVKSTIDLDTRGLKPGEYFLRILPITPEGLSAPNESIHETLIYMTGDFVSRDTQLRVIPEKTVYREGELAHVLITTPFSSGGYLYITRERGGVIDHEYILFTGSTYVRDYTIDDTFYPNVYIGAIAFPRGGPTDKAYAVGYGEIIMDITDKKGILDIKTNKKTYKNREIVSADITMTDANNKGVAGEVEIMVVDESLIRLLGNIDLDIIPKFFQKYPFTMKTAMTAIGIERNRFLSRKGSNGGSGNKGGDGAQISSRTLFQNTAYYNPSILTDVSGKAKFIFQLPDNVTDYRIIAIGQTRSSQFSVTEKTIAVRREYTLEVHAPSLSYSGDLTTITASVFNSTPQITGATLDLNIGTGGSLLTQSSEIILNPSQSIKQEYKIKIGKEWNGNIPYTLVLKDKKGIILDSITKILYVSKPPIIADTFRISGFANTGTVLLIPKIDENTSPESRVTISVSDSPLHNPEKIIQSMIAYPYGCIEQTISSTLPNAVAIQLATNLSLSINMLEAQKNVTEGIAKILKMQDSTGGWKYWEGDINVNEHVTPYVIRSLYEFRKLGVSIPDEVIIRGLDYISNIPIGDDMDNQSEIFATLALGKHPKSKAIQKSIDINKLSRHGYLMYSLGLLYMGRFDETAKKNLEAQMNSRKTESYWYWDDTADRAIYARLLIRIGEQKRAGAIITDILKGVNLESYFISTQSKIQLFMGLIELSDGPNSLSSFTISTGKLKIPLNPKKGTHRFSYDTRRSMLGNTLDISGVSSNLYYELSIYDEPTNIFAVKSKNHLDLGVTRVFEKVDESKGLDKQGQFILSTHVTTGIFAKGELYRVRITVTPKQENTAKYYLTLEDYIPGGWRPIQGIFNTESSSTTDVNKEYGYFNGWTHVEARIDRIFVTQDYIWQSDHPYTYTYYIRPEYVGTYLLPPVTAYYMYQPEIHSTGKYTKITVQ
ncbi:hypothetical protein H7169_01120 [Candidatus Gracilibacteria bacterium]|nr:hypothetical protein [Candidatus Gracilibacteria bacterium]